MLSDQGGRLDQPSIVLVEADKQVRAAAKEVLAEQNLPVCWFSHSYAAYNAIAQYPEYVALVFSDLRFPGDYDGRALAAAIWKEWPAIPVILTSGDLEPQGMPSNARFIPKPWEMEELLDTIEHLVVGRYPNRYR